MTMTLEQILEMWKKDSEIDEMNLDVASRDQAKLHSKYLELLSITRLNLKRKEQELNTLMRDKWEYYNGKMLREEMDKRGWPYDPFKGLKILKNDMSHYFNADPDLQKMEAQIAYLKTIISTLEEIMGTIKWRNQQIRNIIEWRKFTSGG